MSKRRLKIIATNLIFNKLIYVVYKILVAYNFLSKRGGRCFHKSVIEHQLHYRLITEKGLRHKLSLFYGQNYNFRNNFVIELQSIIYCCKILNEAVRRFEGICITTTQWTCALSQYYGYFNEVKAGEGKTIIILVSAFISNIDRKGTHVYTFNDYLVLRDAINASRIFNPIGISVGALTVENWQLVIKDKALMSKMAWMDIIYSTCKTFSFCYLSGIEKTRAPYTAIVDEADNLIYDQAYVPIILSEGHVPFLVNETLKRELFNIASILKEKKHYFVVKGNVFLNELGLLQVGKALKEGNLKFNFINETSFMNLNLLNLIKQYIFAIKVLRKNVDYSIYKKDNKIVLLDPSTSRISEGSVFSYGLQEALYMKENIFHLDSETRGDSHMVVMDLWGKYCKVVGLSATLKYNNIYHFLKVHFSIPKYQILLFPKAKKDSRFDFKGVHLSRVSDVNNILILFIIALGICGRPIVMVDNSHNHIIKITLQLKRLGVAFQKVSFDDASHENIMVRRAGSPGFHTICSRVISRGTDMVSSESYSLRLSRLSLSNALSSAAGGTSLILINGEKQSPRLVEQIKGRVSRRGSIGTSFNFSLSKLKKFESFLNSSFNSSSNIYSCRQKNFESILEFSTAINNNYLYKLIQTKNTEKEKILCALFGRGKLTDSVKKKVIKIIFMELESIKFRSISAFLLKRDIVTSLTYLMERDLQKDGKKLENFFAENKLCINYGLPVNRGLLLYEIKFISRINDFKLSEDNNKTVVRFLMELEKLNIQKIRRRQ